jgi:hypothetical protein
MKYFPDEPTNRMWARYAVAALPLVYLIVALLYSANSAPWGRQVDPESAYAMNGLAWAAGYPMMLSYHPGTTTILLVGIVIKLWAFLAGRSDVIEFGLKNYDAIMYASRTAEALILAGALLASGVIVRNATHSSLAAALFQVAPFVSSEVLHFEVMLIPESLMVSCAILGIALALKAALDERPPTIGLGAAAGLIFALGLSSKILAAPLAIMGVSLLRNRLAFATASLVSVLSFWIFNRVFNPNVFSIGFHWLVSLATHKGIYGEGEAGVIDFNVFWPNMGEIIAAGPVIFVVFTAGAIVALAQMVTSRRYQDSDQPDARRIFSRVCRTACGHIEAFSSVLHACFLGTDRRRSRADRHRDPPAIPGSLATRDLRCSSNDRRLGPVFRGLWARVQGAAAGSQLLPQSAAQEFSSLRLCATGRGISLHRGADLSGTQRGNLIRVA